MNIDERLQALTQSVELLASLHRDSEKRMEQLAQEAARLAQGQARLAQGNARLEGLVTEIAEGTARLLRVAEVHEQRIRRLEER